MIDSGAAKAAPLFRQVIHNGLLDRGAKNEILSTVSIVSMLLFVMTAGSDFGYGMLCITIASFVCTILCAEKQRQDADWQSKIDRHKEIQAIHRSYQEQE